ncbi:SulP family inorganic anion transporter [Streptomyces sp. NPDC048696]|uniref:SulP family inorganic anion transporter n=1 Tax=Streptomyces sp. NPDC048696 TaxID=3365585 RepID=UPI0037157075
MDGWTHCTAVVGAGGRGRRLACRRGPLDPGSGRRPWTRAGTTRENVVALRADGPPRLPARVIKGDPLTGVTEAAYLVPQVMAYANVAGLPPVSGLRSPGDPPSRCTPCAVPRICCRSRSTSTWASWACRP